MSLNVAYSYCINLTLKEKLEIDNQVRKNTLELKFAIFFPFVLFQVPIIPIVPFLPLAASAPQQILRTARNQAKSARLVSKGLDNLKAQLRKGEFHAGRGAKKLSGTKTVFYYK